MSIRSHHELDKLRAIGRVVCLALERTRAAVRPGVTTRELDEIGARVLAEHGAESAPRKVYGVPGGLWISGKEEAIQGSPADRVISEGDVISLDMVAWWDGLSGDAS